MEERRGYVSHIVYRNVENGYTVFELENPDEDVEETWRRKCSISNEGEYVCVRGELVTHPIYQEQLKVMSCEVQEPDDELAMLRYLSSVRLPVCVADWQSGLWINSGIKPLKS